MLYLIAYADSSDPSGSNMLIVLVGLGLFALVGGMAVLPVAIAWSRSHRQSQNVMVLAIFWGMVAIGTVFHIVVAQFHWASERMLLIKTGYYDPDNKADAPQVPYLLLIALVIVYLLILAWSLLAKASPASSVGAPKPQPGKH